MCKNLEDARMWMNRLNQEWDEPKQASIHQDVYGVYTVNIIHDPEVCGFDHKTPRELMDAMNKSFEENTNPKPEPKEPRKPSRFESIIQ
jgi:hypothetical protein